MKSGFYAIVEISLDQPTHIAIFLQSKTMVNNLGLNSQFCDFMIMHFIMLTGILEKKKLH